MKITSSPVLLLNIETHLFFFEFKEQMFEGMSKDPHVLLGHEVGHACPRKKVGYKSRLRQKL